jgi:hypothetical protein
MLHYVAFHSDSQIEAATAVSGPGVTKPIGAGCSNASSGFLPPRAGCPCGFPGPILARPVLRGSPIATGSAYASVRASQVAAAMPLCAAGIARHQHGELNQPGEEEGIGPNHEAWQVALSRRKQGFESPRERQRFQVLTTLRGFGVQRLSNKRLKTAVDIRTQRDAGAPVGPRVRSRLAVKLGQHRHAVDGPIALRRQT